MHTEKMMIALADDHVLLRSALAGLIRSLDGYDVLFEASNGNELIRQLDPARLPDLVLIDVKMPEMDGYASALWLKQHYPDVKVLALSMYDNENAIIRMIKNGARGYILKDIEPRELKVVLESVRTKGYYYSEMVTNKMVHAVSNIDEADQGLKKLVSLSDREIDFLKWACTELTYKEIADKLFVSPRTVDGYRDTLFDRLQIKTRIGLVLYALRNGIVSL